MVSPRFLSRGNDADAAASGQVQPTNGCAGDRDPDWWELFAVDVIDPAEGPMWRRRTQQAAAAAVATLVVAGAAVAASSMIGRSADEAPATVASHEPAADATAQAQLLRRLPRGYDAATCAATAVPPDAVARVRCGTSVDPSGPATATFVVDRTEAALTKRFDESMRHMQIVNCPGGIQSPGPWHRSDTPQQDEGVVVCGYRDGVATVVWTKVADLTVNSVAAETPAASAADPLDRIFRWWSTQ